MKHILYILVAFSTLTVSWGEDKDVSNKKDKDEVFKNHIQIIRQTEAEWQKQRSAPMMLPKDVKIIEAKFATLNKEQLHSPLASVIPIHKAEVIYIFFNSQPQQQKNNSISDNELKILLQKSVLVTRDEIVSNATGEYGNIRFEDKNAISIQIMIGGKEGNVTLRDGTSYWFQIPKDPIKMQNKSQ